MHFVREANIHLPGSLPKSRKEDIISVFKMELKIKKGKRTLEYHFRVSASSRNESPIARLLYSFCSPRNRSVFICVWKFNLNLKHKANGNSATRQVSMTFPCQLL